MYTQDEVIDKYDWTLKITNNSAAYVLLNFLKEKNYFMKLFQIRSL